MSDLESIHSSKYLAFIRASGFGIERLHFPNRNRIAPPPIQHLVTETGDLQGAQLWYIPPAVVSNPGQRVHHDFRYQFLNPDSLGIKLSEIRATAVVGFLPHAFYRATVLWEVANAPAEPWTVERLELVSLLKFPEPRVYVLDHLPRMDELSAKNAPTRELDDFERDALEQLRTTEDVVVNDQQPAVRMLGALRASSKCLECHNVPRGALLGAFSYRLRPTTPEEINPAPPNSDSP